MKRTQYRRDFWTRERVIAGLKRFYRDFKVAPTSIDNYHQYAVRTGAHPGGIGNPYPGCASVLKHYRTFCEAWEAAGIDVGRGWVEWTAAEDFFIAEWAGIITCGDMGEIIGRSTDSVKRRLYDLGINTRRHQGWTAQRIQDATGVPYWTVKKYYLNAGKLPFICGTQCWYIDPADIVLIKEIDWDKASEELQEAVRLALMRRLISILKARR